MLWKTLDIKAMELESPAPSSRQFAFTFAIIALALVFLFRGEIISLYFSALSVVLFVVGFFCAGVLRPLAQLWHRFGLCLSWLMTPLILMILYMFVIAPTGVLLRVFGHKSLSSKGRWILKEKKPNRFERIF